MVKHFGNFRVSKVGHRSSPLFDVTSTPVDSGSLGRRLNLSYSLCRRQHTSAIDLCFLPYVVSLEAGGGCTCVEGALRYKWCGWPSCPPRSEFHLRTVLS